MAVFSAVFAAVFSDSAASAQEAPDAAAPDADPPVDPPGSEVTPPEPRLHFGFRRTRWIDVLEWLAERSDLSLELDAPPPGSFNYSDTKSYTPTEAIDLINSVLATKGYTLTRRERMLVLIDLKGGVPRALLPEVTLDELDQRGKFEMVSVKFPIDGRNMEAVVAETKVLLGPFGAAAPLPGSGQILVSDRAGVMRTIDAVIKKIPKPSTPSTPPEPKEPEKPEFGVYALGGNDPKAALETLKALVGGARFVHDPEADQINVYATPTEHVAIKQIFGQMQAGAPTGNRPRLDIYPLPSLDESTRQSVLSNLAIVAPTAQMRFDDVAERLFVWAKAAEQDAIRTAIVKLLQASPRTGARRLKVYQLRRADPTTLSTLLQTTIPRARITVDATGRRLIVHASAADHQTVAELVEQIDAEPPEERRPVLRLYPIDRRMADRITKLIAKLVPEAEVSVDATLGRASVVATPEVHARVEPLLAKITEAAVDLPATTVETFQVPKELRIRFEFIRTLLSAEIPNAKLLWNAGSGELTVWATADDHLRIGTFLDQMGRQPPPPQQKKTIEVLQVPKEFRDRFEAVQTLLAAELPEAQLTWNPAALELTVWATSKEARTSSRGSGPGQETTGSCAAQTDGRSPQTANGTPWPIRVDPHAFRYGSSRRKNALECGGRGADRLGDRGRSCASARTRRSGEPGAAREKDPAFSRLSPRYAGYVVGRHDA